MYKAVCIYYVFIYHYFDQEMLTSLLAVREKKGAKDNKVLESLIG